MNTLLLYLVGTLLRAGVLALLLGGWSRVGKVRSWMVLALVAVALLPFGFEGWRSVPQAPVESVTVVPVGPQLEPVATGEAVLPAVSAVPAATDMKTVKTETSSISIGWAGWIGMAYIVLTLFWGVYRLWRARGWLRQVRSYPAVTDERLLRIFADARNIAGMTPGRYRNLSLRNSGEAGIGPACCGWRHGIVLFPEGGALQSDDMRLRMLLMHELEHLRRGHHRMSWIVWGLESVFWFNPGMRILLRGWKVACEVECDEAVGKSLQLTPCERAAYAGLLLELAAGSPVYELPAPGVSRDARQLKQRMTELIMKTNKIDRIWCSLAALAVVALIGLWIPMTGAAAALTPEQLDAKVAALRPPELETQEWVEFIYPRCKALIAEEKYEEALVNFVWFWEHILEYGSSMSGVRVSFLLSEWKSLGDVYPPAREEMIRQRDKAVAHLMAGNWQTGSPWIKVDGSIDSSIKLPQSSKEREEAARLGRLNAQVLADVIHLSSVLGESEYVVNFLEFVDREHPKFLKENFNRIERELQDAGGYALASKYIPDINAQWGKDKEWLPRMFEESARIKAGYPDFDDKGHCVCIVDITRSKSEKLAKLARWQKNEELAVQIENEMNELEKEYLAKIEEHFGE